MDTEATPPAPAVAEPDAPQGEVVLVVDDNPQNRLLAEGNLSTAGYEVLLAASGREALEVFEHRLPDVVLLDIFMPGMDGFETCSAIRALPGGAEVPIVFLTAAGDGDVQKRALASGADDLLAKPIQRTELLLRVRSLLRTRRFARDLKRSYHLIRQQRDALTRERKSREELLSFVVNDLRAPLDTIDESLVSVVHDPLLPDEYRESLELALRANTSARRIARNLLDVHRSEDGSMSIAPAEVDLRSLLEELRWETAARVELDGVRVALHVVLERATLSVDRDLLRRVLENLLENATRFAPRPSVVTIEASSIADEMVEIRVSDEGPGVPPEMRERIFEKYARVESTPPQSRRAGSGLGLTFCRLAVLAHGGQIWVDDGVPRGSVFCVRLPVRR